MKRIAAVLIAMILLAGCAVKNDYDVTKTDAYQEGYQAGYNEGYEDGHSSGREGGYESGYEDGYLEGYDTGYWEAENGY